MSKSYDISQPIVFVLRRGRNGRGYLVSPLDKMNDCAPCANAHDIGEVAVEILDDPAQARFDPSVQYSDDESSENYEEHEDDSDIEDIEAEDENDPREDSAGSIWDIDSKSKVPVEDQIIGNIATSIFSWGKSVSDKRTAAVRSKKKRGR